jgi:hypothetical protein
VPTFGPDTIRRFTANTSELKKMAARNYEDFLQVRILEHVHSGFGDQAVLRLPSLYLRASFPNLITLKCSAFYSISLIGMG